jgi:C1q domain
MSCRPSYPYGPCCAPACPPACQSGPTGPTGPTSQQVAFSAVGLTGGLVVAAATTSVQTPLPFNYVLFQKGSSGSSFNTTTNAFTVPTTGLYRIGLNALATNNTTSAYSSAQLNLVVNGTTLLAHNNLLATNQALTIGFTDVVSLTAGQVVWVSVTSTNGVQIAFSTGGQPPWTALFSVTSLF